MLELVHRKGIDDGDGHELHPDAWLPLEEEEMACCMMMISLHPQKYFRVIITGGDHVHGPQGEGAILHLTGAAQKASYVTHKLRLNPTCQKLRSIGRLTNPDRLCHSKTGDNANTAQLSARAVMMGAS